MQLDIELGEERIAHRGCSREPSLFRLGNGDLLLTFHAVPDVHFARRLALRSTDGGATWKEDAPRSHREQAIGESADGVVLAADIYTFEKRPGEYVGSLFRSKDGGKTFSGPEETVVRMNRVAAVEYPTPEHWPERSHPLAKFYIPLPGYYAPIVERSSRRMGFHFWRYLLESKGSWLATMAGKFHGDSCYRSVLVGSDDEGRSWDFISTIAYQHGAPGDGFCEPVLTKAADGSLLCVLRRGGGLPLAQVRSTDGGATWSEPRNPPGHGVDPDLFLLSNGVLACAYGRPGRHIMFSADGSGRSWGWQTDLGARSGSSYMGIAEISPNTLLLVYDDFVPETPENLPKTDERGAYNPDFYKYAYIGARTISVRPSTN